MGLEDKMPQMPRQLELPLVYEGEAQTAQRSEEESTATPEPTAPGVSGLMERVVERENLLAALNRVRRNKGSSGVDGMAVGQLKPHLLVNWWSIREELLLGSYQPQPVRQKLIPKDGGKTRMLGIPTVLDRFIQQALLQVLQPIYDPDFSDHSHGFRPGRSAHGALKEARDYIQDGREWVVDVDLSKFFDRVSHDILMGRIARRIKDRRVLGLIRRYLNAGIMANGVVTQRDRGTPQGGPLSPLLANILLDEVDQKLEERGHKFVRYADDSRVFVQSKRAGERVMGLLERLYGRLQLVINEEKSAIAIFWERPFLGYRLYPRKGRAEVGFAPARKSKKRFRKMVRGMTQRKIGKSMRQVIDWLTPRIRGWRNYYRLTTRRSELRVLDGWTRRRLRALQLRQWKNSHTIARKLRKLGANERECKQVSVLRGRWWYAAYRPVQPVLTTRYFNQLGLPQLVT